MCYSTPRFATVTIREAVNIYKHKHTLHRKAVATEWQQEGCDISRGANIVISRTTSPRARVRDVLASETASRLRRVSRQKHKALCVEKKTGYHLTLVDPGVME